jgi:protoporphyrinogen oxidase
VPKRQSTDDPGRYFSETGVTEDPQQNGAADRSLTVAAQKRDCRSTAQQSRRSVPRILILGAGCTGLGAAWRLHELGHRNFLVLERNPYPGGLSASFLDDHGFTWDIGGHVQFSHYPYFDNVMQTALPGAWLSHTRRSHIWMRNRFVPYPLQNNLRYLPQQELFQCLTGLAARQNGHGPRANFREWIESSFGRGIADVFLLPYNAKVWAHPPETMSSTWVAERVATIDLTKAVSNIITQRDDDAWGPNRTFQFPAKGGTGAIWRAVAGLLPAGSVRYGEEVASVDTARRAVRTADGTEYGYDALVSTLALDILTRLTGSLAFATRAERLDYATTHVVGVGIRGTVPDSLRHRNWVYFPESDCPFYRVTVFSNYSPENAPAGHWSLMAEVSSSPHRPADESAVVPRTLEGLKNTGFLKDTDEVVSTWRYKAVHGYPVPSVTRDEVLHPLLNDLEQLGIWSRGRFGAWKYEVGNQDHSFMQGVEAVNRILRNEAEKTVWGA